MSSNLCVMCGVDIPEGRQVCPSCKEKAMMVNRNDLEGKVVEIMKKNIIEGGEFM